MIGDIENAMLARVKAASDAGAVPYHYGSLLTWPKEFDSVESSETVRYPAAWAAFAGAHKVERLSSGLWRVFGAFGFVVAAENRRNEQARRHGGSPAEPGSYQLAQDAVRFLSGHRLGLPINPLEPTSILPVETSEIPRLKLISIYAVTFDTTFNIEAAPVLDDIHAFKTFHADWDPWPYGHVNREALPDDAGAIAGADNVKLEQP